MYLLRGVIYYRLDLLDLDLHKHTVEIHRPGTWSFLITGPAIRRWGFWVDNKLHLRDRYFATSGHHPCSSGQRPVRRRPDGSYI